MSPVGGVVVGVLAGLITSAAGAYVALRKWRAEVRALDASTHQGEATAASTLIDAARSLLEPYQEQINLLRSDLTLVRARINTLDEDVRTLLSHVNVLEQLMREGNMTPPPRPPLGGKR